MVDFDGDPRQYSHFCFEVAYESFGDFSCAFGKSGDELHMHSFRTGLMRKERHRDSRLRTFVRDVPDPSPPP